MLTKQAAHAAYIQGVHAALHESGLVKSAFLTEAGIGALAAPEGKGWEGAAKGVGGGIVGSLAGGATGGLGGAALGGLASLLSRGKISPGQGMGAGAAALGIPGAIAGDLYGAYRGGSAAGEDGLFG